MQRDMEVFLQRKKDEDAALGREGDNVLEAYKCLVEGIGSEVVVPHDLPLSGFLSWLAEELKFFEAFQSIGRGYAFLESLGAFAQCLIDTGCEHQVGVTIQERQHYWSRSQGAKAAVARFYDEFWMKGGRDLALIRAALSRGHRLVVAFIPSWFSYHLFCTSAWNSLLTFAFYASRMLKRPPLR